MKADCDLIIFDKTGTITDFQLTWIPTIRKRIDLLTERHGQNMRNQLQRTIGMDSQTWIIDPSGPLLVLADAELRFVLAMVLYENGISWTNAIESVNECYRRTDHEINRIDYVKLLPGVDVMLRKLKQAGILLAVATMDTRAETNLELSKLGIRALFDTIIAYDDVNKRKPDPEMITVIC